MIEYIPIKRKYPPTVEAKEATWGDISTILLDIIERFNVPSKVALEFGVATGHSISALSNYFGRVIGIDTFREDITDVNPHRDSKFYETLYILRNFNNIQLIQTRYEDFITAPFLDWYNLIHVDLIHNYDMTFQCGDWSLQHSGIVLFHDTMSFPEVMRAVTDLSIKYECEFYNYPDKNGLGILIR